MSPTTVTESNFTVAETDHYFAEHSAKHPVNTWRHVRRMSDKDHQFVIRENQDTMYSHAVVDCSKGASLRNPAWDVFSVLQIIDENHYTVDVVYPGEEKTITPDMLAIGTHVFINGRTGVRTFDEGGFAEAHAHQDAYEIRADSAEPYEPKGFDTGSLDAVRSDLITHLTEMDHQQYFFGTKEEVTVNDEAKRQFLIASAAGWGGLPVEHATYLTIAPSDMAKSRRPAVLHLRPPPLRFELGGFFSVCAYDATGWIRTEPYSLNNRQLEVNRDGTYTIHFNAPELPNNIQTVEGFTTVMRLYMPESVDKILEYVNQVQSTATIEAIE
jgi:hypothetical protein